MWNFIEINHEKYLIKFKQNGTYIECVLTNFRVAWHEQLTIDTLLNRGKTRNPVLEYGAETIIKTVLQASDNVTFEVDSGKLQFKYTITGKIPYYFYWNLTECDSEYFMNNVTSTMLQTMMLFSEENRELRSVISKKDAEIEQYKYDGAILSRKHLATPKFDQESFENRFKTKETNEFADFMENSAIKSRVLSMCNIDINFSDLRSPPKQIIVESSIVMGEKPGLNIENNEAYEMSRKRKHLTIIEKLKLAIRPKMSYDDDKGELSDDSGKEITEPLRYPKSDDDNSGSGNTTLGTDSKIVKTKNSKFKRENMFD